MLIVLDTNVLVSGLLKRNSIPGKILDDILEGKLQTVLDDRILHEYEQVLHRPRLSIPSRQAEAVLGFLAQSSLWAEITHIDFSIDQVPDPRDIPFAEAAICSHADALVTGNAKHFAFLERHQVRVVTPHEFIELIQ